MKFLLSKRGLLVLAVLVLILFLWRPGVSTLRNRIAGSIGSALGRRVTLDDVSLHFLPRPGFDLAGLVIYDDPAFSGEPMIRAQDVSAAIRVRSLLRGRLEIATLSASEPSINLVRNHLGRWNLASLLERNAQIPAAPTAKPGFERRPSFPYLEASNARINFKTGHTKRAYALVNADVALWQDSENSWGARLKAEPVRTDFNLTDTGVLQINAAWQRAATLASTPVRLSVQWRNGQLGQISQLVSGKDRGWRGGVSVTANLTGTPEALYIESQTTVNEFHRYDIASNENLRLATNCQGQYNWAHKTLRDLVCESPTGTGRVRLRGTVAYEAQLPTYDLTLEAQKVPVAALVRTLRQAKKQIPADLTASGVLNAEFHATRSHPAITPLPAAQLPLQTWSGSGALSGVRISSRPLPGAAPSEITLGTIPLALESGESPGSGHGVASRQAAKTLTALSIPYLQIGPATVATNTASGNKGAMDAGGLITADGYRFFLRGDSDVRALFRVAAVLDFPVAQPVAEGSSKADISLSGTWQGFAGAMVLGSAQLRNVRTEMRGLHVPIEITSASLSLSPDSLQLQKLSARTGKTQWTGSVTIPRYCAVPDGPAPAAPSATPSVAPAARPACRFQFELAADQVSTQDLADWFIASPAKRPWYRMMNPGETPGASPWLELQAIGNLRVGRFGFGRLVATRVTTRAQVDHGRITLSPLAGQLLQGTHKGEWSIDFSGRSSSSSAVRYHGAGIFQNISLADLAGLMNNPWISGTADAKFDCEGTGDSLRDLLSHSDGEFDVSMRNGSLDRVEIPGAPAPLPVHHFSGSLVLRKGDWELSEGKLESLDGLYQVKGSASSAHGLDVLLRRGDEQSWLITGSLADPHVEPSAHPEHAANAIKP